MRRTARFLSIVTLLLSSDAHSTLIDACNTRARHALQQNPIVFASADATLSTSANAIIQRLAAIALDCPDTRIEIGGHTDNRGEPIMNQSLSYSRAQAVADALVLIGISGTRVSAAGFGSARPVADNTTRADRARNRRITVLFSATDRPQAD